FEILYFNFTIIDYFNYFIYIYFITKNKKEEIVKKAALFSEAMINFIKIFSSLSVLIRNDFDEIINLFHKKDARKMFLKSEFNNILNKHSKKSDIDSDYFNLNTLSQSDQRKVLELILLSNDASDFLNNEKISNCYYKLEVHHLFPHSKYKDNCIFLLTLISEESNRQLKDLNLEEQRRKIGIKKKTLLEKHLIPTEEYERKSFIDKRAKLFSDEIRKYY
ncbi:hypothetical protein, partial [Leptospira ognonensis]|uniref:hypothetical protein n=1 Tax=Leptospira ognonensis TaxID=2484945 RepID=UPI001438663E